MKDIKDIRNLFNLFYGRTIGKVFRKTTHTMEVNEHDRRLGIRTKQGLLSDCSLKLELLRKYGISKWSSKLIKEVIDRRIALREKNNSVSE